MEMIAIGGNESNKSISTNLSTSLFLRTLNSFELVYSLLGNLCNRVWLHINGNETFAPYRRLSLTMQYLFDFKPA